MASRSPVFPLAALLAVSPLAAFAGGDYGSVSLHEDEQNLIDSSKQLHNYFEAHALLYNDDRVLGLVRRIGHEIRPMPSDDYVEYEFYVLRDPSPNAFALPNGHVYVNTGMLARLDDEDQLAAVLAHEISHVAGHHGIIEHRATK
jgi:predicted Zn-dependent protease